MTTAATTAGTSITSARATAGASQRLGVELEKTYRRGAALAALVSLSYAFVLGWRADVSGIAVAAAFAVGFLFATFALSGVVPASIKVGDVELRLAQAKEDGRHEGRVDGIQTGALLGSKVVAGEVEVEEVAAALHEALTSPGPLRVDGVEVPVAQMPPAAAKAAVGAVEHALQHICTGAAARRH
jgi:hypothetical protein